MEKEFVSENRKAFDKLLSLSKNISDEDLLKTDKEDWTLGIVFGHIAFWDQRTLVLFQRWNKSGIKLSPVDTDVINETMTPLLRTIPSRAAIELALATAEAVCREIEDLPDELTRAIDNLGDKMRLNRHIHWNMHIDQIEKIIRR